MTDRPRQVYVECSDPRALGSALMTSEGVIGTHIEGENLRVEASDARALAMALPSLALTSGVFITSLYPSDESLESVFRYLIENQ
jgi:ABC-2 type transport system ATP-binding protein